MVIVQPELKQYRVRFYEELCRLLGEERIELALFAGRPLGQERLKRDHSALDVGKYRQVGVTRIGPFRYIRVPLRAVIGRHVVVEQASRNLNWYLYTFLQTFGLCRVAIWGHGRNRQDPSRAGEAVKQWLTRKADWCFAYTEGARGDMIRNGANADRVTNVENSTDTRAERRRHRAIDPARRRATRERLKIPPEAPVAVYCGSLYGWKRIPALLDACRQVRARGHDIHLIVIGAGIDTGVLAQEDGHWLHYPGALFGEEKALYMSLGSVFLCPGLVGLAVLDAFAAGLPVLTMDHGFHSPEIEYLEHDSNGLVCEDDLAAYVDLIDCVLSDPPRLAALQQGAWEAGEWYSAEAMASRFARGVSEWTGAQLIEKRNADSRSS